MSDNPIFDKITNEHAPLTDRERKLADIALNAMDKADAAPVEQTAAKAWVSGATATAIAFLGALGVALTDGVIDPVEWTVIGVATLTAFGGAAGLVYATPNKDK